MVRYFRIFMYVLSQFPTLYPIVQNVDLNPSLQRYFQDPNVITAFWTLYPKSRHVYKISQCANYCAKSKFSTWYPNFRHYIRKSRCFTGHFVHKILRYIRVFDVAHKTLTLYLNFGRYIRNLDVLSVSLNIALYSNSLRYI